MATAKQQRVARVAGLSGVLLLAVSVAGLVSTRLTAATPPTHLAAAGSVQATSQRLPGPVVSPVPPAVPATKVEPVTQVVASTDHYPLQVGRYWVYQYLEPGSDVVTVVERAIVRREVHEDGKELFIFDDGGVVYVEKGKVFEMSSSGGVNIIPVDPTGASQPVVYRSQGMQIEKSVGALDTSLVVGGRRFDACLEVITRFRAIEADARGAAPSGFVSYSSFYAPGIGMVGRQNWPRDERGSLAVTLADHGIRQL